MFIVLGATGHIGSELVRTLDAAGKKVIAVVRNVGKADSIRTANLESIVLDVEDTARLNDLFRRGRRAFLLNPPGDPGGNTDASETATARFGPRTDRRRLDLWRSTGSGHRRSVRAVPLRAAG